MEVKAVNAGSLGFDTLILPAWTEGLAFSPALKDSALQQVQNLWNKGKIKSKAEEVTVIYDQGKWEQVLVLGLGERQKFRLETAKLCGAALGKALSGLTARHAGLAGEMTAPGLDGTQALAALVEGILLGNYSFDRYKTKAQGREEPAELKLDFLVEPSALEQAGTALARAKALAAATNLARDLVNEPGNKLTPAEFAARAEREAARWGLEYRKLEFAELGELGMGGIVGVGKGAQEKPVLVQLSYRGKKEGKALGLVGKGITFDSGGISLKPAGSMEEMKSDMAGGAAVLAAMTAIAKLKLPVDIFAFIPLAENLPSGNALKPGDVLTMFDGTSVEIISTDCEGRLVLADAISYALKLGCEEIVDVATLTGACSIALGPLYSGLWANDRGLQERILNAAGRAGEKVWPMPYDPEFFQRTKGRTADLKNTGGREGGACTAAAFLGHFAGNKPWAHLDIAPTGWADIGKGYTRKGGTGVMVRTLVCLAEALVRTNVDK